MDGGEDSQTAFSNMLEFLDRLESQRIWYRLEHIRDSIMVVTAVPGERWEIEFFADGLIEVERFFSRGIIEHEEMLDQLVERMASSPATDGFDDEPQPSP